MTFEDDVKIFREHGFDYKEKVYWLTDGGTWISAILSFTMDDGSPVVKYYSGRYSWGEADTTWDRIKKFTDKSHLKRKPKVN